MKTAKRRISIAELCLLSLLAALMLASQVVFSFLPNIELVSLLVMLYTLLYRYKALYIIYVFVLLEGFLWGFGTWWFCYLYVWTILWGVTMLTAKIDSLLFRVVISGVFGMLFGAFTALVYLCIGGPAMAFSYWVSGIPFDILHCAGNMAVTLVLFKPLYALLKKIQR